MTDERSAAFFAIGLALHGGSPAAVCCTSGSALLNIHPAVSEAFYQQVPLIVISADRPGAWIGQMDGQTLPQPSVFGPLVKKSVNLPEIHTDEDEWHCNRLINEALLELNHHGKGPVHINVHLSAPLSDVTESGDNNDFSRVIEYIEAPQVISTAQSRRFAEYLHGRKILVVGGFMPPDARLNKGLGEACRAAAGRRCGRSSCKTFMPPEPTTHPRRFFPD